MTYQGNELFVELGRLCVVWEHLERILMECVTVAIETHEDYGYAVSAHVTTKGKCDLLCTAVALRTGNDSPVHKSSRNLCNRILDLKTKRNEFVHGIWFSSGEGVALFAEITARRVLRVRAYDKEIKEINRTSRSIVKAHEDLESLICDVSLSSVSLLRPSWLQRFSSKGRTLNRIRDRVQRRSKLPPLSSDQ